MGNMATGHDANNDDTSMTMCTPVMNNGQYEIGSGGNGGAIYGGNGNDFNITLCGDAVQDNAAGANAFGGGLFFTSDNMAGVLTFTDTTMNGNSGGHWTNVSTGSVTVVTRRNGRQDERSKHHHHQLDVAGAVAAARSSRARSPLKRFRFFRSATGCGNPSKVATGASSTWCPQSPVFSQRV